MVMNQPSQRPRLPREGWQGAQSPGSLAEQPGSGPVHFWAVLTGPGDNAPQFTLEERNTLRRARLASAVMFGMLLLALLALPLGLQDPTRATLGAVGILFVAVLIAALLNRFGHVTSAGLILVATLLFAIGGSVMGAPILDWIYLPAFDLLSIVVGVAALVLPRPIMWGAALASIALVVADMFTQKRSAVLEAFVAQNGIYPLVGRPVIAILLTAVLFHLITRFMDREIRRADRGEELAELERRELERTRELEEGVRQLLAVHVHLANGDFNVKVPTIRNQLLWQIGSSLNNLVARLGRLAQSDFVVRRTQEETNRLVEALYAVNSGRTPIWPNAAGTPLAALVDTLRTVLSHRGAPGGPAGVGGPQGLHLPPAPGGHPGPGYGQGPNPNYVDPGSRVPTSPNPPSSAFPAYPGNPPGGLPPAGQPAAPDWMRALMPDQQHAQEPPYEPPLGQMPQSRAWQAPAAPDERGGPDMAGGYGAPPAPEPSAEAGSANPWSLDPGAPLDDAQLPAWLRDPNTD